MEDGSMEDGSIDTKSWQAKDEKVTEINSINDLISFSVLIGLYLIG